MSLKEGSPDPAGSSPLRTQPSVGLPSAQLREDSPKASWYHMQRHFTANPLSCLGRATSRLLVNAHAAHECVHVTTLLASL